MPQEVVLLYDFDIDNRKYKDTVRLMLLEASKKMCLKLLFDFDIAIG